MTLVSSCIPNPKHPSRVPNPLAQAYHSLHHLARVDTESRIQKHDSCWTGLAFAAVVDWLVLLNGKQ